LCPSGLGSRRGGLSGCSMYLTYISVLRPRSLQALKTNGKTRQKENGGLQKPWGSKSGLYNGPWYDKLSSMQSFGMERPGQASELDASRGYASHPSDTAVSHIPFPPKHGYLLDSSGYHIKPSSIPHNIPITSHSRSINHHNQPHPPNSNSYQKHTNQQSTNPADVPGGVLPSLLAPRRIDRGCRRRGLCLRLALGLILGLRL
jgi:hypothetical protein